METGNDNPARGGKSEDNSSGYHSELDPELLKLPKLRVRIGWLLAISVAVFSLYVAVRLRFDCRFSRQPNTPETLSKTVDLGDAPLEGYYAVPGHLDTSALVRVSDSGLGQRLVPFDGTNRMLWLVLDGDPFPGAATYSDNLVGGSEAGRSGDEIKPAMYTGRLRRADQMPFFESAKTFFAQEPAAEEAVSQSALRLALSSLPDKENSKTDNVVSVRGNRLSLKPSSKFTIEQTIPKRALIIARATQKRPDGRAWAMALIAANLLETAQEPTLKSDDTFVFEVPAPDGVEAANEQLVDAKLYSAWAKPITKLFQKPWTQLKATDSTLILDGVEVPWQQISAIRLVADSVGLPKDARVLLLHQRPGDYWYVLPAMILLALGAALFSWAGLAALRNVPPTRHPSS